MINLTFFTKTKLPTNYIYKGIILYILLISFGIQSINSQEYDRLEYNVQVNAQIIPIYAIDNKGNPVYDLKVEDIELSINHSPPKILYFMKYQVEGNNNAEESNSLETELSQRQAINDINKTVSQTPVTLESNFPERLNFIILDGISNSKSGVRNAKKLAEGLIQSGGPGDGFVLLKSNMRDGLQYVVGPEKNKTKLLKIIEKIYQEPRWIILVPHKVFMRGESPSGLERMFWLTINPIHDLEQRQIKDAYQSSLNRFSKSLEDFKRALKTIRLPKKIFLVSGGIQEIAFFSESINDYQGIQGNYEQSMLRVYYGMLKKASIAINEGGSLLYMINPIPEVNKIKSAIKTMSDVSNAKCISATTAKELLAKVKKNTSAYYEIAFTVTPEMKEKFKIDLNCKRKNIRLNTLQYGEKSRPYLEMDDGMKKLFALNVVTGGSWSRIVAKLAPVRM